MEEESVSYNRQASSVVGTSSVVSARANSDHGETANSHISSSSPRDLHLHPASVISRQTSDDQHDAFSHKQKVFYNNFSPQPAVSTDIDGQIDRQSAYGRQSSYGNHSNYGGRAEELTGVASVLYPLGDAGSVISSDLSSRVGLVNSRHAASTVSEYPSPSTVSHEGPAVLPLHASKSQSTLAQSRAASSEMLAAAGENSVPAVVTSPYEELYVRPSAPPTNQQPPTSSRDTPLATVPESEDDVFVYHDGHRAVIVRRLSSIVRLDKVSDW